MNDFMSESVTDTGATGGDLGRMANVLVPDVLTRSDCSIGSPPKQDTRTGVLDLPIEEEGEGDVPWVEEPESNAGGLEYPDEEYEGEGDIFEGEEVIYEEEIVAGGETEDFRVEAENQDEPEDRSELEALYEPPGSHEEETVGEHIQPSRILEPESVGTHSTLTSVGSKRRTRSEERQLEDPRSRRKSENPNERRRDQLDANIYERRLPSQAHSQWPTSRREGEANRGEKRKEPTRDRTGEQRYGGRSEKPGMEPQAGQRIPRSRIAYSTAELRHQRQTDQLLPGLETPRYSGSTLGRTCAMAVGPVTDDKTALAFFKALLGSNVQKDSQARSAALSWVEGLQTYLSAIDKPSDSGESAVSQALPAATAAISLLKTITTNAGSPDAITRADSAVMAATFLFQSPLRNPQPLPSSFLATWFDASISTPTPHESFLRSDRRSHSPDRFDKEPRAKSHWTAIVTKSGHVRESIRGEEPEPWKQPPVLKQRYAEPIPHRTKKGEERRTETEKVLVADTAIEHAPSEKPSRKSSVQEQAPASTNNRTAEAVDLGTQTSTDITGNVPTLSTTVCPYVLVSRSVET